MTEEREKYRLLVHCRLKQIQEGFGVYVESLPVTVRYVDLSEDGMLSKLRFDPHLIVLLLNREDSDFTLPIKLRLFSPSCPVLIILPPIPDTYLSFLKFIGVEHVIQLPTDREFIADTIKKMLSRMGNHGIP